MMTDPLTWSPISLGRWSGTQVRVHIFLIVFVLFRLLNAAMSPEHDVVPTLGWLGLLLLALAVHELGHALMASWLGCEREEVRLWPLGNLVGPSSSSRSSENALVALAGPIASASVVLVIAIGLSIAGAHLVWSPFGHGNDSGAPLIGAGKQATALTPLWWFGWFGYLNWVLLIANLIPALPFDGGRVLRSFLANAQVVSARDNMLAPWTARSCAALLVLVGLARLVLARSSDGLTLIGLAVLIELIVRAETRMLEDGGFFEDGVFGYDFTEGYTSLENGAAKVRPYRESALKRWRRRRSDLRRQRQQAREAAEDRRMDEILAKLHQEGRSALTEEEQRFLLRVSAKYRNRPKAP
jgi:stage IV sporulation protein FB